MLRRPTAFLLAAVLLLLTWTGGTAVHAEEASALSEGRSYQSRLAVQGTAKTAYEPGDTVVVELSVDAEDSNPYGVRLYDNTLTVDTTRVEVVTASGVHSSIQLNYLPDGSLRQKVKWVYQDTAAQKRTAPLTLGTITLKVKTGVSGGSAVIEQSVKGIADAEGQEISDRLITADPLTLTIENHQVDYLFGLQAEGGLKSSYAPGETLTVRAYLSSNSLFRADLATDNLCFSPDQFELVSYQAGTGVSCNPDGTSGGNRSIRMTYNGMSETGTARVIELVQAVLRVKEGIGTETALIWQEDFGLTVGGQESLNTAAEQLQVSLAPKETCSVQIVPRKDPARYERGEELTADIVIQTAQPFVPRMISEEISFSGSQLTFVTASALEGASVGRYGGTVRWLYHNQDQSTKPVDRITLGSITLKVEEDAALGSAFLNQNANLAAWVGNDSVEYTGIDAAYREIIITDGTDAGVTVRGNVALTVGDASKISVVLTTSEPANAADAYKHQAKPENGDLIAAVTVDEADRTRAVYEFSSVPKGSYTLLIRKPGALYYQKNGLVVGDDAVELADTVVLPVGDLNKDGGINSTDLSTLLLKANYGKSAADAELGIADLNDDGGINATDLSTLLLKANYGQNAVVVKEK